MLNSPDHSKSTDKVPNKYSINLMWLNKELNEKLPYINNSKNEGELLSKLLDGAKKWKDVNPEAEVVIWYDSNFVTEDAIKNTQEVLDRRRGEGYNIVLKDIRELDLVKSNTDAFSRNVPIYFRIDILKLIICVNSILQDFKEAAIFADLELCDLKVYRTREEKEEAEIMGDDPELTVREQDGKPQRMTKEELFDDKTMKQLKSFGFLTGGGSAGENQFVQLMRNEATIKAIMTYINVQLSRLITSMNMNDDEAKRILIGANADASPRAIRAMRDKVSLRVNEMVYKDYDLLLSLILSANSQKTNEQIMIREENTDQWVKYDPDQHGIAPLGNLKYKDDFNNTDYHLIVNQESVLNYKDYLVVPDKHQNYVKDLCRQISYTKGGGAHSEMPVMPTNGKKFNFQTWESVIKGGKTFIPAKKMRSAEDRKEFKNFLNFDKENEAITPSKIIDKKLKS